MPNSNEVMSGSDTWLRMSLALAFVIGLVFLSAWLFRKISFGRVPAIGSQASDLKISARIPLGEKRFLMVVSIAEKHFLLGVTPQNINLISELDHFNVRDTARNSLFERLFTTARNTHDKGDK